MAVTSIWPIKGRVKSVIKYAMNPEKTNEDLSQYHEIEGVVEYAANELKTEKREFVTVLGCTSEETAAEEFMQTKEIWGKLGGRVCYHGYQSFAADEVDAKTAHDIGVELAKRLWGDRFQVVIATHCNTGHYHNHFVINSVSCVDGYKFYNFKSDYQAMKEESDRICREYGLSVIRNGGETAKSYSEWKAEQNGEPTVRGSIREAIDTAIKCSTNIEDFKDALDQMGFVINQTGKYPKIKHKGSQHFVRFRSLGPGYDINEIADRIDGNYHPEYPNIPKQESPQQIFEGESAKGLDGNYRCFVKAISITMTRPETNRYMFFLMRENHRQFKSFSVQSRILAENHIETDNDLLAFKTRKTDKLNELLSTRTELRNALKRAERAGDSELAHHLRFNIDLATRQINDCRDEVKACDSIAERSGMVKEKLEIIKQNKFRGKEKLNDEHISGSSRSDRENDTQRH